MTPSAVKLRAACEVSFSENFGPSRQTETLPRGRRPKRRLLAVKGLFDDAVDLDDGPRGGDGLRLALAGLVDDDRGALVEDAARGCIVLLSPCGQPVPGVNAPGMVALNDEGGLIPARRCLQGGEDAAKDAIGESQTVEVGAVALLGVVVADAAPDVGAVGDGDVQEDEVRLVGAQQLGGVLLQVNVGQEI